MSRSVLFQQVRRVAAISQLADRLKLSTADALAHVAQLEETHRRVKALRPSRREVLQGLGAVGLVGAFGLPERALAAKPSKSTARIAIIGGGMAGLSAGYTFYGKGVNADIFEASDRAGGRVWSITDKFPGMVGERGAELIDTTHTTMRGFANAFGFALEDYDKAPGEPVFYAQGQTWEESEVVDEYRDFVAAMRADLQTLSPPTADDNTPADALLDYMTLDEYLQTRGAGDLLYDVLEAAYIGEYGRRLDEQSSLNLLLFMHADKSSKFREFGVFSDERFHVVGGNQQIPNAIADLLADQMQYGHTLTHIGRDSAGAYTLTFDTAGGTRTLTYDYVLLTLPFSVLRGVDLSALDLPAWKTLCIDGLQYGSNTKMLVGFDGRPWAEQGSNGGVYAHGLDHMHNVWETNWTQANGSRGLLTNYSGGDLAESYEQSQVQQATNSFLTDLDVIYPGISSHASRDGGAVRVHLEKWSINPLSKGSYTSNQPGYFTTMAERERVPVDRLYFAGEHTDSFYEWQGYMEGAANSGIASAKEILAELRVP